MAFDLLPRDGRDLNGRPMRDRRARLEGVVAGRDLTSRFAVRAERAARLAAGAGNAATEELVAKDETSPYVAGAPGRGSSEAPGWTDSENRWRRRINIEQDNADRRG
jgi:ATP-dependent DNA ligase